MLRVCSISDLVKRGAHKLFDDDKIKRRKVFKNHNVDCEITSFQGHGKLDEVTDKTRKILVHRSTAIKTDSIISSINLLKSYNEKM